ncbi:hypothetical protein ACFWCQ_36355, partial [Streptomyces cyaneofuscatus]|uniref:hypothetical protein n=1 Tax=Streptomyces cyaneofuscatus TaxID=66883 RepID=UPI00365A4B60
QLVERNLAKVEVASSNLVVRSTETKALTDFGQGLCRVRLRPMTFVMSSGDSAHCSRARSGGKLEA